MYSGLPPRHRRAVKASLASAWALSAAAGLSAVVLSPTTIIAEIGLVGTLISGILLTVATVVAVFGVIANRYWLEWVASWGAAVALAPYLITVWALVVTDTWTRSTQAFLVTSLLAFYLVRSALCSAHAAKLREAHTVGTAAMDSVGEEVGDADASAGG